MTDTELFELNRRGFIPGPQESEQEFSERVKASENFFSSSAFGGMDKIPDCHWDWTRHHLLELYDFQPCSVVGYYSNRELSPWQGAASWVMDVRPGPISMVQLRKGFCKGQYLKIYSRDEILAHEAVHAARAAFEEPLTEEFFAYLTSSCAWRRVLGPIVQRPWEVWLLFSTLCAGAFLGNFWLPTVLLAIAFIRLGRQHLKLWRAAKILQAKMQNPKKVRALLLRLTDREICGLSQGKELQDDGSLRFRIIRQYLQQGEL